MHECDMNVSYLVCLCVCECLKCFVYSPDTVLGALHIMLLIKYVCWIEIVNETLR